MPTGQDEVIDIEAMQRQIAELQAKLAAAQQAQTTIATGGGAAVEGSVQVANGHFIGRDYLLVINQAIHNGEDSNEAKSVIALYLEALVKDLAGLKLGEIDSSNDKTNETPLQLGDIYVPLNTTQVISDKFTLDRWLKESHAGKHAQFGLLESRRVGVLEALAAHRRLTLLGQPGSGKSTFGARVLLALAQVWQGHASELAALGEQWTHGALLPIRVVLRRFAEQLPAGGEPARAGELWTFIGKDLDAAGYGMSARTIEAVQRIARTHGALILLDGLDECGDAARRERVMAAVNELIDHAGDQCRFILTARPYAWPDGTDPMRGVYALADLDDGQIERFIRAWYAALVTRNWLPPGDAEAKCEDLLAARHRQDLRPLARNPLLLTLMATLHRNHRRLPDDRADLYNESVDLLLLRWNRQIGADRALLDELDRPNLKLSDLREVLEELAFKVHEQNVGQNGAADIGEDRLIRAFRPLLDDSRDKAAIVVTYIEKRAGLLIGQGEKGGERQFSFPHRTFQEFLAACHLAAREDFPGECVRLARTQPAHWQIVLPLAARLAKAERGASAADQLIGGRSIAECRVERRPESADWTCARLAGLQLLEIGSGAIHKDERRRAIASRVAGWLAASLPVHPKDGGESAPRRAQAGDVLAALGDPRFDPQRFHLPADDTLGFVRIPADPKFRIGTRATHRERVARIAGEVWDDEINDEPTPTLEFYIARYPVTVGQFRAFVDADGFEVADIDALRDLDNKPVRWVSWDDAIAYCDWLTRALGDSLALADNPIARLVRNRGWQVVLPSELEWEKAARGGLNGKVFSWGDRVDPEMANYGDSGVGESAAVGCFPANNFGLYDMIGNVWEWTRSPDVPYRYRADDLSRDGSSDGSNILVRGGSWDSAPVGTRCAVRVSFSPDYQFYDLGFRLVLRSPLVRRLRTMELCAP